MGGGEHGRVGEVREGKKGERGERDRWVCEGQVRRVKGGWRVSNHLAEL